ncbi:UNVERIFIED_CONTAM: hypothetical protein HDU68_009356 [Siphonaria sp. JEL0065]|nr:hypothetical protein HDU68_009356 [Siphonaria sp. JEL0065]
MKTQVSLLPPPLSPAVQPRRVSAFTPVFARTPATPSLDTTLTKTLEQLVSTPSPLLQSHQQVHPYHQK